MLRLAYAMMRAGYLTPKQLSFWNLRRQGLTQAEVSQEDRSHSADNEQDVKRHRYEDVARAD